MTEIPRRVMNMIARGVIAETNDQPGMQNAQVSLLFQEGKTAVERLQNYGFSGHPPAQSEVVVVFMGGGRDHGVIVAVDDRDSRFTGLAEGEVAIYTNEGDSIVLKRDNTVEVTTKHLVINAELDVAITTPTMTLNGDLQVNGNLTQGSDSLTTGHTVYGDLRQRGTLYVDGDINASGNVRGNRPLPTQQPSPLDEE
jgi:phage baseplate assembly protein V